MKDDLILRKTGDFNAIYKKGKSSGSKYVVVLYKPNGTGLTRKAFVASKKVGNSVMRNRARRLMREAVRLSGVRLPEGYDFLFIARNGITVSKCADVKRSIEAALKRTGLTG